MMKRIMFDTGLRELELLIGQSQSENDVIIKNSDQNDLWFHLENVSGPHFVLKNYGEPVPKRLLSEIATLFREYKTGLGRHYNVIYTEIRNVKRTNTPGQVIPRRTSVIRV